MFLSQIQNALQFVATHNICTRTRRFSLLSKSFWCFPLQGFPSQSTWRTEMVVPSRYLLNTVENMVQKTPFKSSTMDTDTMTPCSVQPAATCKWFLPLMVNSWRHFHTLLEVLLMNESADLCMMLDVDDTTTIVIIPTLFNEQIQEKMNAGISRTSQNWTCNQLQSSCEEH